MTQKKSNPQNQPLQPVKRFPIFDEVFQENLGWWYKTDKSKVKKILDLVTDTMAHPFEGLGKPEPLKYLAPDSGRAGLTWNIDLFTECKMSALIFSRVDTIIKLDWEPRRLT